MPEEIECLFCKGTAQKLGQVLGSVRILCESCKEYRVTFAVWQRRGEATSIDRDTLAQLRAGGYGTLDRPIDPAALGW